MNDPIVPATVKRLWVAYLALLVTWACCCYVELGRMYNTNELFALMIRGRPHISDFMNVYNCSLLAQRCASGGGSLNIYDPKIQTESLNKLIAPIVPELPFYAQYPPIFFVVVKPLSLVPLKTAWIVWSILGAALLTASVRLLTFGQYKSLFSRICIIAAVFSAFPTWLSFKLGQPSLLLFPGVVAIWCLLERKRFFQAGLASIVCLIKLQYLPLVAITGFILGRFRYLNGLLMVVILALIVSVLSLGLANVLTFPKALLTYEASPTVSGVSTYFMQNIRGQLVLLTGTDNNLVSVVTLAGLLVGVLLCAMLWHKSSHQQNDKQFKLNASITTLLMLVTSPHTHVQDYLLAAIPCLWLYRIVVAENRAYQKMLAYSILFFPVLSWVFFFCQPLTLLMRVAPYLLWATLVILLSWQLKTKETH